MFLNRFDSFKQALQSTAIRQGLILFAVFALSTTTVWLATYFIVVSDTRKLVETRLNTLAQSAELLLTTSNDLPEIQPEQYLVVLARDGGQLGDLPVDLSVTQLPEGYHHLESDEQSGQTDYIVLVKKTYERRIIAIENIERLEQTTDIFLAGLQLALGTSLIATFFASYWIARRYQTRLDKIGKALELVSQGELGTRIKLQGPVDDLSLLADRLNATTARLDTTIAQLRVQTANIAHDLRTPLARLRAVLEKSLTALVNQDKPVNKDVLEDALLQIDLIVQTFNGILRIAQIENGERKSSFTSINLGDVVDNVVETFEPVIEDQGHSLVYEKSFPSLVMGDADMIVQLLGNLIQNALRHGASSQQINLSVSQSRLCVTDKGPGIPKEDRERVMQPLFQRNKDRQQEGFGLGLALVAAICQLHDAKLELTDGPDGIGLRVCVQFPFSP